MSGLFFRSGKGKQKVIVDSGLDDFDEVEEDPLESAIETKYVGFIHRQSLEMK